MIEPLQQPIRLNFALKKTATNLVTPFWDCFFAGGLGIALYLLMAVSARPVAPDPALMNFVYGLSFIGNFPHFMASYQLLYSDFGREIPRNRRYFWAAICVPVMLVGMLSSGIWFRSAPMLGYMLHLMYFFVGWHYTKQTFGVILVTNALKKVFYSKTERLWLLANMYAVWMISFINSNVGDRDLKEFGVTYQSLGFSHWLLAISYVALTVCIFGVVISHLRRFIATGDFPAPAAVTAYVASLVFLVPAMHHPFYAHMIPFFHSIQYLLFVFAFRHNKVRAEVKDPNSPVGRKQKLYGVAGYFFTAALLGAYSFRLIPWTLDGMLFLNQLDYGSTPFLLAFTVFLNIHHYFIDNVIWRGDNQEMRRYLFSN